MVAGFSECDNEGRKLSVVHRCRERWEDLQATDSDQVRYCNNCPMSVFHVADTQDFQRAIAPERCVMVKAPEQGQYFLGMPAVEYATPKGLQWDD